jgi:glycosyl transferase family 2
MELKRSYDVAPRREPVSIICVFNDPEVRRRCLDRSIEHDRDGSAVEYIPIDNVDGSFETAGAALNRGAALANHNTLVFVHQDVYLHSLRALEEAAGMLADDQSIGLLGAVGVDAAGKVVGRIRDRVVLVGEAPRQPTDVASLDEVLFMIPRRLFERESLSEISELGWHAYAVEYGLRARSLGLRICAVNIPLTHNSLTLNVERLNVAYDAVAARYPAALPLPTTCGVVTAHPRSRARILASHGWRYRWLRESVAAHAARRVIGRTPCVLSDIRFDIDDVIAGKTDPPLLVVSLDHRGDFTKGPPDRLELMRLGQPIVLTSGRMSDVVETVEEASPSTSILLTNLRPADLRSLARLLPSGPRVLGFRREVGYWMLLGPAVTSAPQRWRLPRSTPWAMPALAQ